MENIIGMDIKFENDSEIHSLNSNDVKREYIKGRRLTDKESKWIFFFVKM